MFFLSLTILFFRCSILKACFTAVFPSLIRLQQSRGSAGFQRELDVSDKMVEVVVEYEIGKKAEEEEEEEVEEEAEEEGGR